MDSELHHDCISLPKAPEIGRRGSEDIEVWHDPPNANQEPCVVLYLDDDEGHAFGKDLFPSEARADQAYQAMREGV